MTYSLRELLAQIQTQIRIQHLTEEQLDCEVGHLSIDSREIKKNSVFFAIKGNQHDTHRFIQDVVPFGPACILGEEEPGRLSPTLPYVWVQDSRECLSQLAAYFYGDPSQSLLMIGITGTSGKTTTSYLVESILKASGHCVGVMGTISCRYGETEIPSSLTSPGPLELQQLLSQMKDAHCTAVVMEVSSHALKQKRVSSVAFDGMIFTNLSPEHLDYHESMDDYFASKSLLFTELARKSVALGKKPVAVINEEDPFGLQLISDLNCLKIPNYLVKGFHLPRDLKLDESGISFKTDDFNLDSTLSGRFNALNVMGAASLAFRMGIQVLAIEKGISDLVGVPGRLEKVNHPLDFFIWVDYAHKPDALENVIRTLRALCKERRLITVFGCGGDRDRLKRPQMGAISAQGSDYVIVTSDNPRTENPEEIIHEILKGMKDFRNYEVEVNRERAIFRAIEIAQTGEFVLIAGKGHEKYQIVGVQKNEFDDVEVAKRAVYSKHAQLQLTQAFQNQ